MPQPIEVKFKTDPASFQKMEELNERLGTPNIMTAIHSAVLILNQLFDYEDQGYQIAVVKNGHIHAPEAPTRPHTPIGQWIKDTLHLRPR